MFNESPCLSASQGHHRNIAYEGHEAIPVPLYAFDKVSITTFLVGLPVKADSRGQSHSLNAVLKHLDDLQILRAQVGFRVIEVPFFILGSVPLTLWLDDMFEEDVKRTIRLRNLRSTRRDLRWN
jgi:hypothetical protein